MPVYDLCRGSAEVGNLKKCKCQKRQPMPRLFRNAKLPMGVENSWVTGSAFHVTNVRGSGQTVASWCSGLFTLTERPSNHPIGLTASRSSLDKWVCVIKGACISTRMLIWINMICIYHR